MVSMDTSLTMCIAHILKTAIKLIDTSPPSGALFGIIGTGPVIKNLEMPKAPAKELIMKLRMGRPWVLNKLKL